MKKRLIALSLITVVSNASDFKVIIDSSSNDYEIGGFTDEIVFSEWKNKGTNECELDLIESDIYLNRSFVQTEICVQEQERTETKTRTYNNGSKEVVYVKTENKEIETISTQNLIGTHLESNCFDILNNGYSLGDGQYPIINGLNVLCDMTTDNGGWTLVFNHDILEGGGFMADSESLNSNTSFASLETDKYSILGNLESFRRSGNFEFRLAWKGYSEKNIWSQTSNPTTSPISGYSPISVEIADSGWGGLERGLSQYSFIDGSVGTTGWYFAIGSRVTWGETTKPECLGMPASDLLAGYYCGVPNVNLWVK